MAAYNFGITLASSGINITCMRIVSEELALENNTGIKKSSNKCIFISLLFSFIASLIFFLNSDYIIKTCFENKVNSSIVNLICIALPLISVSSAINGYFTAVRRVYKSVIGQILEQISKIVSTILLFSFSPFDKSIQNTCFILILGDAISEFFSFVYLVFVYIIDINNHYSNTEKQKNNNLLPRIFKILLPISFTSCIKSGISSFKQIIIPSSLQKSGKNSSEALSNYGIISGMAMPIVLFPAIFLISVSGLIIPEFSRYYIKKDYHKIIMYTDRLIILSFLFACIIAIFFLIFGNYLGILIYHRIESGTYIKLFSLIIPFMYVDIIIDNILKSLDAQTDVMIINIIDLIFSTLFIFLFVPKFGIKGYILSIYISEILNLSLSLHKLLKLERSFNL